MCAYIDILNINLQVGAGNFEKRGLVEGDKKVRGGPRPVRHSCPIGEG